MPPKHSMGQLVTAKRDKRGVRVNNSQWTNIKSYPPRMNRN